MNEFTTVFEITADTNGVVSEDLFRITIGAIVLIAGIFGLLLRRKTEGRFPKKLWTPSFMTVWATIWLLIHIPLWRSDTSNLDHLFSIYQEGKHNITEGIVQVTHEQPAEGHAPGDKIIVSGQKFEINYFRHASSYRLTIAYGGALREGEYARLHHYDGRILKVEIRN